jgi:hypothetical protein
MDNLLKIRYCRAGRRLRIVNFEFRISNFVFRISYFGRVSVFLEFPFKKGGNGLHSLVFVIA